MCRNLLSTATECQLVSAFEHPEALDKTTVPAPAALVLEASLPHRGGTNTCVTSRQLVRGLGPTETSGRWSAPSRGGLDGSGALSENTCFPMEDAADLKPREPLRSL